MKKLVLLGVVVLLAGCGGKPTSALLEQLRSRESAQRLRAIKALERKRSEAAVVVPALAQALADEDAFVRRDAARALGRFGTDGREAVPALVPLLRDRNAGVRKAAAGALRAIDPATAARLGA
jgi:HEAT repeat protein